MKTYEELLAENINLANRLELSEKTKSKLRDRKDSIIKELKVLIAEGAASEIEVVGAIKAERDALAAKVEILKKYITDYCGEIKYDRVAGSYVSPTAEQLLLNNKTPSQCLAEIKAEAYEAGFCKAKYVYKCELGYCSTDIHEWFDEWEANKLEVKVRKDNQSGTWLKDSNVNGGKRQGGE